MKVALTGGGTAGHTSPLLAVADNLRERDSTTEFIYIGQKGDHSGDLLKGREGILHHQIYAGKFRRFHTLSFWQQLTNFKVNFLNLRDIFLVIIGFFQALLILQKSKPDVMFCKGGYVVVPVGWAARLLRIPYITHDSDTLPGLANRLIAKGAVFNAVAHKGVVAYPKEKTVVTGVPVANEYLEYAQKSRIDVRKELGIDPNEKILFIFAGTLGAKAIDDMMESIAGRLLDQINDLRIIHVFGKLNDHVMKDRYQHLTAEKQKRIMKLAFIPNAYAYITASDVLLGRAGATTLAEIATIGRASVIVPAEQLTGGHQLGNAIPLAEAGAVKMVRQTDTFPNDIYTVLVDLLTNEKERKRLEKEIRSYAGSSATSNIAELITQVYVIYRGGETLV